MHGLGYNSTEPISNTKIGTRMATATMPPTEMCFAFESSDFRGEGRGVLCTAWLLPESLRLLWSVLSSKSYGQSATPSPSMS